MARIEPLYNLLRWILASGKIRSNAHVPTGTLRFFYRCSMFILVTFIFSISGPLQAQSFFPTEISPLSIPSPQLDFRYLNEPFAGIHGFVQIKDGHFADGQGNRLKFWGINLTGDANFPEKSQAPALARWIASSGFNLLRLHFMDRNWGPGGLLVYPDKGDELDPIILDKLDFFQSELKKCGVYVNVNLHVGRAYEPGETGLGDFSKGVDNFYAPYVQSLKSYATQLLTHRNPYTGLEWRRDPAVALVEVNNENALTNTPADYLVQVLKEPWREDLRIQWEKWILKTYPKEAQRSLAWRSDFREPRTIYSVSLNPQKLWTKESWEGAKTTLQSTPKGLRLEILKAGKENWHTQIHLDNIKIDSDKNYKLTFQARSPHGLKVQIHLMNNTPPWDGLSPQEITLVNNWHDFTLMFNPQTSWDHGRINMSFAKAVGVVEIQNLELQEFSPRKPISPFPLPNPEFPSSYTKDFVRFLEELEINYAQDFHNFLKKDLGIKVPITHTQVNYGGFQGLERELKISDYLDIHAYHDHPNFPGKAWDPNNWEILNIPLGPKGGELSQAAYWRVEGIPFVMSEWNIPAPNEYRLATVPAAAVIASIQDWDGIVFYTLSDFHQNFSSLTKIQGFFDFLPDPLKINLLPWGALSYRLNKILPLDKAPLRPKPLPQEKGGYPGEIQGWPLEWALKYQLGIDKKISNNSILPEALNSSSRSLETLSQGTGAGTWWTWGYLPREVTIPLGEIKISPSASSPPDYGGIFLVTLDNKSWKDTKKALLVMVSGSQNTGMLWNQNKTSVGRLWGEKPVVSWGPLGSLELNPGWVPSPVTSNFEVLSPIKEKVPGLPGNYKTLLFIMERP